MSSEWEQVKRSFLEWINSFESVAPTVVEFRELSDGLAIYQILCEIDPDRFKANQIKFDVGNNWVLKSNNVKRIIRSLFAYYEETLSVSFMQNSIESPDPTLICKSEDEGEIMKLLSFLLALVLQCSRKAVFISRITTLPQSTQKHLMTAGEQILAQLPQPGSANEQSLNTIISENDVAMQELYVRMASEKEALEKSHNMLLEENATLKRLNEDLKHDKSEFAKQIDDLQQSLESKTEVGKVDFLLKQQIDTLRLDLERSEHRRMEAEEANVSQVALINDLNKKMEDLTKKADQASKLKDEVDELKQVSDKLLKSEQVIDKYKKKLEESGDLKRQMKLLEDNIVSLREKNESLEDAYRKVSLAKQSIESSIQKDHKVSGAESPGPLVSQLQRIISDQQSKLSQFEEEKSFLEEQLHDLQEKAKELELRGGPIGTGNFLGDELQDKSVAVLKERVAELERENTSLKGAKLENSGKDHQALTDKIVLLETLLADANKGKAKFEEESIASHQKIVKLEAEMKRLSAGASAEVQSVMSTLRGRISQLEDENSLLKKTVAEKEALEDVLKAELENANANLASLSSAEPTGFASELMQKQKTIYETQIDSLKTELEISKQAITRLEASAADNILQLERFLAEKQDLNRANIEVRNRLLEQEQVNSELNAQILSIKNNPEKSEIIKQMEAEYEKLRSEFDEVQKQLDETVSRNEGLRVLAKRYKSLLDERQQQHQEIMISEEAKKKSNQNVEDNYPEAISSLRKMIEEKDVELKRKSDEMAGMKAAYEKEQKIILSSWYTLGVQLHRNNNKGNTPNSWMKQQLNVVDRQIKVHRK